jgi:tetraacyldisaccharide 4'-kinase
MASLAMKLLLAPFAVLYGMVLRVRALLYQVGILSIRKLPCPVISIGNITVGGTGKTPATMLVAKELQERGYRVAVLSRGYGGSLEGQVAVVSDGESVLLGPEQAGDEPCLLAQTVPGLMVVIGSDRYQAGLVALERLKPDILLLDDGFQHIRLHRDLNILLLGRNPTFWQRLDPAAGAFTRAGCRSQTGRYGHVYPLRTFPTGS